MKRCALLIALAVCLPSVGCVGLLADILRPNTDNLVEQKDFQPDPDFGKNRQERSPARPCTAMDIADIPGVLWFEAIGENNQPVVIASGWMIQFAGKPHAASAGHICRGPQYKAIFACFSEGQKRPEEVEIIACSEKLDACLLRFKNPKFEYRNYPPLGVSARLKKGQKVFTHGTPFGYTFSVSEGIVNKLDFGINDGADQPQVIHHSAKINPGDSGGPLFNEAGEVIGMNVKGYPGGLRNAVTTIYGAVPIDDIVTVFRNLKESGHVQHPSVGWQLNYTSEMHRCDYERRSKEDRAEVVEPRREGTLIWRVVSGGPADKAGLKTADILLEYDGRRPITNNEVARYILFEKKPGDEMEVYVYREVRWVEEKLESDQYGPIYRRYPRMKEEVLKLKVKLE